MTASLPTTLGFGSPNSWTTSGLALMLQGLAGSNYVIQASTDLTTWQGITNFLTTNSPTYFNDLAASNFNQRFYLAILQ